MHKEKETNTKLMVSADESTHIISPKGTTKLLLYLMAFFVAMDLLRLFFKKSFPDSHELNETFDSLFKITGEYNLPTYFSSLLLLLAGLLLLLIYFQSRLSKFKTYWIFLGMVFIFLSLDESFMIHEGLSKLIRGNIEVTGSIRYGTWVVPYLILTAIIGLAYIRFLLHLPPPIKKLFIIAGFTFVLGAGVFELLEGYFFLNNGEESIMYRLTHWSQELLEMAGVIIFIYGLLDYMALRKTTIQIIKQH